MSTSINVRPSLAKALWNTPPDIANVNFIAGPGSGRSDDEGPERVGRDEDHPSQHHRGRPAARGETGRPGVQERGPLDAVKDFLQDGQKDQLLLRELELKKLLQSERKKKKMFVIKLSLLIQKMASPMKFDCRHPD